MVGRSWGAPALAAAFAALSGCPAAESAACDTLCDTLVSECGFAAFPDLSSCQQGCAYEVSMGAELGAYDRCVAEADCDPFAVLACARAHGISAGEP